MEEFSFKDECYQIIGCCIEQFESYWKKCWFIDKLWFPKPAI